MSHTSPKAALEAVSQSACTGKNDSMLISPTQSDDEVADTMRQALLTCNKGLRRSLLKRQPALRGYAQASGHCSVCEHWQDEWEHTFVITHCCGLVLCGFCYEDRQGECADPRVQYEIQASREVLFEKHPELRMYVPKHMRNIPYQTHSAIVAFHLEVGC